MPVRCQDCNSHFLLDNTTVVNGIGCPDCGGTKLERDQPSPTHSDGDLRNMVDPATQLDQGGNPLQEGIWANTDGGWQPEYRRDETFAKVASLNLPSSGIEPQYHETVQPGANGIHWGNLHWLKFLDASINGKPAREDQGEVFLNHGLKSGSQFGHPVTVSVHHPEHLAAAIEAIQSPHLKSDKRTLAYTPTLAATGKAIFAGQVPPPPGINVQPPQPQAPPVMSNQYSRSLPQDPYLPWYHQADVQRYPGDGGEPVTMTNEEWGADRKNRYQDRQRADGHQLRWQPGQAGRGIMIGSSLHTWPVEKTMENPQGGDMHGEYISKLGVNPANLDMRSGFEIDPDGTMIGSNLPPQASQIDPRLRESQEGFAEAFASTKVAIAPLLAMGGRMLLSAALGGLMRKAVGGAGNFSGGGQVPQPEDPYGGSRPVSLVASEHTAVGVGAPVETPDSTPRIVEDHDPESVDQQEFNDGDMSPAGNNPNLNGEAGGSQNPRGGEDGVVQKLEFRHDGEAVQQAEMLLPSIMEYVNSDKSALEDPQLRALHEQLEKEIPNYLDLAGEDDEAVQKFLDELKKPEHVHAMVEQRHAYQGPANMPANNNPQADFIEQALRMVQYYESIGAVAEAQHYRQMAEQAGHGMHQMASTHEAAPPRPFQPWNEYPDNVVGLGMGQGEGVIPCPACGGRGCENCQGQGRIYAPNNRENGDPSSPFKWQAEGFDKGQGQISPERMRQNPELFYDAEGKPVPPNLGPVRQGSDRTAAPIYQNTPVPANQMQMGNQQMAMPGTFQNPVQPGGMPVSGKCTNCGGVLNADGSCPQCGAAAGANQQGNLQAPGAGSQHTPLGIMPSPYAHTADAFDPNEYQQGTIENQLGQLGQGKGHCPQCMQPLGMLANGMYHCPNCGYQGGSRAEDQVASTPPILGHTAADHQGPITPEQKEAFAQYLIEQGRNDEVAAVMTNPAMYADEWAEFINKSTQPPQVDPNEQPPQPPVMQTPPDQNMPVPGMSIPQPTAAAAEKKNPRRCPKCTSATTSMMNADGDMRCHRCGNQWKVDAVEDHPVVKSNWIVKKAYPDALNDSPNPVAAPAAEITDPGNREQQQDSSLSWQAQDGTPLQVGAVYQMNSNQSPIPDVVKVQQVKPDSVVVTMEGEYNSPSDPTDANGPEYTHEIPLHEAQEKGLTFSPMQDGQGDQEQSQDQGQQDGIGQTVNTEPVEQPHGDFPVHSNRQVESIGGTMVSEDPRGQFHVGQEVNYQALGGRPERGFIVGFQPALAMDPFIQTQSGQTKVIARQDVQGDPIQIAAKTAGESVCPLCKATMFDGICSNAKCPNSHDEKTPPLKNSFTLPTDHCPKCEYGHVTSSYNSPTEIQYECFRCAHQWKVADLDEDSELNPESRTWLNDSNDIDEVHFDPRVLAMANSGQGRNLRDIAKRDPRHAEIHERLNKNAGAKFSPRQQKEFIDEEGTARNADRLNLDGTHYVESAFDNTKARPDRVNEHYLGLGL